MKICFFINDYSDIGGIQRVTSMVSSFLSIDNDVHVVSMYQEHGNQNDKIFDKNIHIKTLVYGEKKYIRQSLFITKLLKQYIIENAIDIVISTSEMLSPYCYLATRNTKIKYIVWTHTPPTDTSESKFQGLFRLIGIKTSSLTITLTEKSMQTLKEIYHVNHITYINNPIDPKLIRPIKYNNNTKKIITVGRITYQKYYDKLIEVASLVMPMHKDWIWDIYGEGDVENLKELIIKNNLESQVFVLGNVDDIYNKYKDYSFQVMTSRYEGFPMTILEGLANGLPIVSFNISGVNDIIENQRNGFLIDSYDAIKMSKKIDYLINNPNCRSSISSNNLKDRNKYSLEETKLLWEKCLKTIVDSKNNS